MGRPRLLCVDLDGTCVRYSPRLEVDPEFVATIRPWLEAGGRWVMNSDRPYEHMLELAGYLEPSEQPAALLCRQRDIHFRTDEGVFRGYTQWNQAQEALHVDLWTEIASHFNQWQAEIAAACHVEEAFVDSQAFAFRVPAEEIGGLRRMMRGMVAAWPEAQVSGNDVWSFILHAAFSKRRLLAEAARILQVEESSILALGDGINDLSMLDGEAAGLVGCPVNAHPEVKSAVRLAGGVVARGEAAAGSIEIVRHFLR